VRPPDPTEQGAGRPEVAARPGAGDAELEAHASLAAHQLGEAVLLLAGNLELLRDGPPGTGAASDAMRGLEAGTERARRYVDDLLDLLAAARHTPEPAALDLGAAFATARDELDAWFARAGATLTVGPMPQVRLDPTLAARLCVHLLRTTLASARPAELRIEVTGHEDAGHARIEVRDDGEPLSAEGASELFAAFAPPRGRGPLVGAGVSAALCRWIVEAHGGSIEAQPADGGAVVAVTLARA
jgi:signal transduction histidine kinase